MKKLLFLFIAMLLIGASTPPNLQEIQTAFTARYGPGVTVIIESGGLIPRIKACNDQGCSYFWVSYTESHSVIEFDADYTMDQYKGTNDGSFDTFQEE